MFNSQPLVDANVRADTYYVARTHVRCWRCGGRTRLLALALPRSHETLVADDEEADEDHAAETWQREGVNAFLFYVRRLPDSVRIRLNPLSSSFRYAYSAVTMDSYWANHCEHCTTLLDDHELHCEPDVAFMPASEAAAANIQLLEIAEPFAAAATGYAFDPEFFGCMTQS